MTKDELIRQIDLKKSFLCVGLDVDKSKIPSHLLELDDPIFEFNKRIIDATHELAVAYKPNIAFYEQYGLEGMQALAKTLAYIPDNIFVIADAKRGDIGNTSDAYAKAYFENWASDAITVSPYMGADAVLPYLKYKNKFAIVLGLTSNKGSEDFQQLKLNSGELLYENLIKKVTTWGTSEQIMFVVGATNGESIANARKAAPGYFFLVPGIGAQGGSLDDVVKYGWDEGCCLLVNSSRGIIYAGGNDHSFQEKICEAAQKLQLQMKKYL